MENLFMLEIQLKNAAAKQNNPYSVLIWICSLLLLTTLPHKCVYQYSGGGRAGAERKRFWGGTEKLPLSISVSHVS